MHNGASDGGTIIFDARFSRVKPGQDEAATRGKRWKRAALLAPVLVGLLVVAVVEGGHPAAGKAGQSGTKAGTGGLLAALADPLSLFAERSPGGRGAGPLLSTKPGLAPEERVLSEVRERDPGPGIDPVFGVAPDGLAPGSDPAAGDPGGGDPGGGDPFGGGPGGGGPSFGPFAAFNPTQPELLPFAPGSPPDPGIPAVPEPATWAMLILGFFAVGMAVRRRRQLPPLPQGPAS